MMKNKRIMKEEGKNGQENTKQCIWTRQKGRTYIISVLDSEKIMIYRCELGLYIKEYNSVNVTRCFDFGIRRAERNVSLILRKIKRQ